MLGDERAQSEIGLRCRIREQKELITCTVKTPAKRINGWLEREGYRDAVQGNRDRHGDIERLRMMKLGGTRKGRYISS